MKQRSRVISYFRGDDCIFFENLGFLHMPKCVDIVRHFSVDREFFFGHWRTDGTNFARGEWKKYSKIIPEYFLTNGRYEPIVEVVESGKRVKTYDGCLFTGSVPINDATYDLLPQIFHYYQDTTCFCPKVEWKTFVEWYRLFMNHGGRGAVEKNLTDICFTYEDSGDFSISFNRGVYSASFVYKEVNKILDGIDVEKYGDKCCLSPSKTPSGIKKA